MATALDFTKPHVLRSEEEYDQAVARIGHLLDLDPPERSEEWDELELLTLLVEAYEEEHYPMGDLATPQDVVSFVLEQKGISRADLAAIMGGRSRVSEFFSGKRELSRAQIRAIRDLLGVPADLLL